jgi:hypothetical protein
MCHHLVRAELEAIYDIFYGTREAWFDPTIEAQPQGFCRLAVEANPAHRKRYGLDALDELKRIVAEHRRLRIRVPAAS